MLVLVSSSEFCVRYEAGSYILNGMFNKKNLRWTSLVIHLFHLEFRCCWCCCFFSIKHTNAYMPCGSLFMIVFFNVRLHWKHEILTGAQIHTHNSRSFWYTEIHKESKCDCVHVCVCLFVHVVNAFVYWRIHFPMHTVYWYIRENNFMLLFSFYIFIQFLTLSPCCWCLLLPLLIVVWDPMRSALDFRDLCKTIWWLVAFGSIYFSLSVFVLLLLKLFNICTCWWFCFERSFVNFTTMVVVVWWWWYWCRW